MKSLTHCPSCLNELGANNYYGTNKYYEKYCGNNNCKLYYREHYFNYDLTHISFRTNKFIISCHIINNKINIYRNSKFILPKIIFFTLPFFDIDFNKLDELNNKLLTLELFK